MKFVFPPIEGDLVSALVSFPQGTPIEKTLNGLEIIESGALKLEQELKGISRSNNFFEYIINS